MSIRQIQYFRICIATCFILATLLVGNAQSSTSGPFQIDKLQVTSAEGNVEGVLSCTCTERKIIESKVKGHLSDSPSVEYYYKAQCYYELYKGNIDRFELAIRSSVKALKALDPNASPRFRAKILIQLGNLKSQTKSGTRHIEAYQHYIRASKLTSKLDKKLYYQAKNNASNLACLVLTSITTKSLGNIALQYHFRLRGIDAFEQCVTERLNLAKSAKEEGDHEYSFLFQYLAVNKLKSIATQKKKNIKSDVLDNLAERAVSALNSEKSINRSVLVLSAQTLVNRAVSIEEIKDFGRYKLYLSWFSLQTIRNIIKLNQPRLAFKALVIGAQLRMEIRQQLDEATRLAAAAFKLGASTLVEPKVLVSILRIASTSHAHLGEYTQAISANEVAIKLSKKHRLPLAKLYVDRGNFLDELGEYTKALGSYSEAQKIIVSNDPGNFFELGDIHYNWSFSLRKSAQFESALNHLETGLVNYFSELKQMTGYEDKVVTKGYYDNAYHMKKDIEYLEKVVPNMSSKLKHIIGQIVNTYSEIADIYITLGNHQDAKLSLLHSAKYYQRISGTHYHGGTLVRGDAGTTIRLIKLNM